MKRNRTTLSDVAREAGVSLATVDRVINQRGNTGSETEQRVFEVARKLRLDRALFRVPVKLLRLNIVMVLSNAAYYQKLKNSIRRAKIIYRDMNITITSRLFNLAEMPDAIKEIRASASSCHGLIYAGPEAPEILTAMDRLPASCPIITFATDLPSSRRIAYFGPDNHATGRLAGDLLGRFSGGQPGSVLLLLGTRLYAGHRQREAGFRTILMERFRNLTIEPAFETLEDPERAASYVSASIKRNGAITAIYNTSNGNRAISDFLMASGRADVIFINHELTEKTREHLLHGVVDVVIDHNTDNDLQNAIEYLLFFNHRIDSDQVMRRENLNVYFRETAAHAAPVV